MIGFYFLVFLVAALFAYAGYDATMRLFAYIDITLRYQWIQFRLYLMRRKLEQQLIKDLPEYNKQFTERNNDRS
jgi:hypothetical protein|tara:strand:+ start:84 stop:305 length:222 start_codon:yes stop_codon:yes gene_type:complete